MTPKIERPSHAPRRGPAGNKKLQLCHAITAKLQLSPWSFSPAQYPFSPATYPFSPATYPWPISGQKRGVFRLSSRLSQNRERAGARSAPSGPHSAPYPRRDLGPGFPLCFQLITRSVPICPYTI